MGRFATDPLGWVRYAFPWGVAGTDLAEIEGPEAWAVQLLGELGDHLRGQQGSRGGAGVQSVPFRKAVASGHGITKSATAAQGSLWALSTMEQSRGIITANTDTQLRTKTWPELAKWFQLCITRHWFEMSDTKIASVDPRYEKNWRLDRVSWSEHRPASFQGLHNARKRVWVVFDEAAGIPQAIFDAQEGALTDPQTEIIWWVFGNPNNPSGPFYECHHRYRKLWNAVSVDSRTVRTHNPRQVQEWLERYGEDHDFFKIRVRGVFPAQGAHQLISRLDVDAAATREATCNRLDPLVVGVDVARFGGNKTVIRRRKGRDARTWPVVELMGADGPTVAGHVARIVREHQKLGDAVAAIFVDITGGTGASPFDFLVSMGYTPTPVNFGEASPDPDCANRRSYMWCQMRDWLKTGGAIDDHPRLKEDLAQQTYGYAGKDSPKILLTPKDMMIADGMESPDHGDALALTFYAPVAAEGLRTQEQEGMTGARSAIWEYDPFEEPSERRLQ
jgi:hypothetical protein